MLGGESVFVDTSALVAILNEDDARFAAARETWHSLLRSEVSLVTSNYVVVESVALVQRRLGMEALSVLTDRLLAPVATRWIDQELHAAALAAVKTSQDRRLSLVDCGSFEVMRRLGISKAFAFDRDFARHGFSCIP